MIMKDPIHNERYIVSALSQGTLYLKSFLSAVEANLYADNLRVEVRYDMEARYEQVIVINVESGAITGDGFEMPGGLRHQATF
tara:strand:- start:277 stop:525 length:249 start_codon:yes stop_codon:yes gene_type:complete